MASAPALTVSTVLPTTLPTVAEIVEVPALTAVARPALLIVATAAFEDAQVTPEERSWVDPSEFVPVAVNCCVDPVASVGAAGVTAIAVSVVVGVKRTSTQ